MQKELLVTKQGFSLIEVLISSALLLVLSTLFISATLSAGEGSQVAGSTARATFIAQEGLEAVRNLRDYSYASLTPGTYGLSTSTGTWTLSGSSDTQGIFTRIVTIQTVSASTSQVTSTVTWQKSPTRSGVVSLTSKVSDLSLLVPEAKSLQIDVTGGHVSANTKVVGIKIKNIGTSPITLSSTTISWTGGSATHFTEVDINGAQPDWASVGPGYPLGAQVASSTVSLNLPIGVLLQKNSQSPLNAIIFDGSMHNTVLTIQFIMSDGSSFTVTTPLLP